MRTPVLEGTDSEVRQGLYDQAEKIIAAVHKRGNFIRAPQIDFGGAIFMAGGELRIIHKCEVCVEIFLP